MRITGYESADFNLASRYGKICLIGCSSEGPFNTPVDAPTFKVCYEAFGDGRLVQAWKEATLNGASSITLIRVDPNNNLYDDLELIYNLISDLPYNIIVPLHVYADDNVDYVGQLARMCSNNYQGYGDKIGIIGLSTISSTSQADIFTRIDSLNKLNIKEDNEDIGYLISVVVQECIFGSDFGYSYVANGAAAYAGLVSSVFPGKSPTMKAINCLALNYTIPDYNIEDITLSDPDYTSEFTRISTGDVSIVSQADAKLRYVPNVDYIISENSISKIDGSTMSNSISATYSINEHLKLSGNGYVSFIERSSIPYVYRSITASQKDNLSYMSSIRIVQSIIGSIKEMSEEVVGLTRNEVSSIEGWIQSMLDAFKANSVILDYKVSFTYSIDELEIKLYLSMYKETTGLSFNLSIRTG